MDWAGAYDVQVTDANGRLRAHSQHLNAQDAREEIALWDANVWCVQVGRVQADGSVKPIPGKV